MENTIGDCIVFDDLRTQKVKLGGREFTMTELSGGKWEKFNIYLKFISKYEQMPLTDLEAGIKTAEILNEFKKNAVKLILSTDDGDFIEKEVPPQRLLKFIEIQKEINGLDEVEEMLRSKNPESLGMEKL